MDNICHLLCENEFTLQFWHPLQLLTMPTKVPTNQKTDNLKNGEIWNVNLMIRTIRIYILN